MLLMVYSHIARSSISFLRVFSLYLLLYCLFLCPAGMLLGSVLNQDLLVIRDVQEQWASVAAGFFTAV